MTIRLNKKSRPNPLYGFHAIAGILLLCQTFASCTEIDCPLDNIVEMGVRIYDAESSQPLKLSDTLTVRPAGRDTILLNRAEGITDFYLPLRYTSTVDTFLLRFSNAVGQVATDTLWVTHNAHPHFESIDCPATVFHAITSVRHTSHALRQMPLTIDSVVITNPTVNYDNVENLSLYLRSTAR